MSAASSSGAGGRGDATRTALEKSQRRLMDLERATATAESNAATAALECEAAQEQATRASARMSEERSRAMVIRNTRVAKRS